MHAPFLGRGRIDLEIPILVLIWSEGMLRLWGYLLVRHSTGIYCSPQNRGRAEVFYLKMIIPVSHPSTWLILSCSDDYR